MSITALATFGGWALYCQRDAPKKAQKTPQGRAIYRSSLPPRPPCDFWRPWQKLAEPYAVADVLRDLNTLVAGRAPRTEALRTILDRGRAPQRICVFGGFEEEDPRTERLYRFDGRRGACRDEIDKLLDVSLDIQALAKRGLYDNTLIVRIGAGAVTSDDFVTGVRRQLALLRDEYSGWEVAFPKYAALNRSAFLFEVKRTGIMSGGGEPALPDAHRIATRTIWHSQKSWQTRPHFTNYVLKIADMIRLDFTVLDDAGEVFFQSLNEGFYSSFGSYFITDGADILSKPGFKTLFPTSTGARRLTFRLQVTIHYKGLVIGVKGVDFSGSFERHADSVVLSGNFLGIESVEVGGRYQGYNIKQLNSFLHETIEKAIKREVQTLLRGRSGSGWTYRIELKLMGEDNVFKAQTSFSAPINLIEIFRQFYTPTDVSPDALARSDLEKWVGASLTALIEDARAITCSP